MTGHIMNHSPPFRDMDGKSHASTRSPVDPISMAAMGNLSSSSMSR